MGVDTIAKRFFYRIERDLDVRFRIIGEETRGEFVGRSRNLSAGGMLLSCEPIDVATVDDLLAGRLLLACRLRLRGDDWIEATARVSWSEGVHRIGVHFTDLAAEDQERISRFVMMQHVEPRRQSVRSLANRAEPRVSLRRHAPAAVRGGR